MNTAANFLTSQAAFAGCARATAFIGVEEKFESKPYLCPAGKWTIGYGSTRYADGRAVQPTDPEITLLQGASLLSALLAAEGRKLVGLLDHDPTANQWAALLSLAYNCGIGVHDGIPGDIADSTLLAKFNREDIAGAADEFPKWDKAHVDGRVVELPGLKSRRLRERTLFLTP